MRGVTEVIDESFGEYGISTHTPHARRDGQRAKNQRIKTKFLLTRLMRGVTCKSYHSSLV